MDIQLNQAYQHKSNRLFREKDNKQQQNAPLLLPKITEAEYSGTKLTLSSNAFSMLRFEQELNNTTISKKVLNTEPSKKSIKRK